MTAVSAAALAALTVLAGVDLARPVVPLAAFAEPDFLTFATFVRVLPLSCARMQT
ncbi:MAG: hypothetical protein QF629_06405 [Alphaproteobacteria bacterium]|nr:hypothetical protein [Alphaproteobacteria bacterium]MDP7233905.1 hypothetical protein [Alphaproteobacteria bacterium]MDP7488217.1 hypothetical protein [Alphaproteobacteria bacterium]HJN21787.1 hypothetical protein [Alphaproteobacteria bacterium]